VLLSPGRATRDPFSHSSPLSWYDVGCSFGSEVGVDQDLFVLFPLLFFFGTSLDYFREVGGIYPSLSEHGVRGPPFLSARETWVLTPRVRHVSSSGEVSLLSQAACIVHPHGALHSPFRL